MIEKIIYDKDDGQVQLVHIEPGASFLWDGEYLCKRLVCNGSYEVYDMKEHKLSEGIPAMVVSSGEIVVFKEDTLVEPAKVEHHVIG